MFKTKDNIKKAKLDTAVLGQEEPQEVIKSNTENVLDSDLVTFNQMKNFIKENTDDIMKAIGIFVKYLQTNLKKKSPPVEVTDDSSYQTRNRRGR